MLEYIKWRGDLSFADVPFCEVDALIFSQLAYLHFRDALGDKPTLLHEAAPLVEALQAEPGNLQIVQMRHALLAQAAASKRFGMLMVAFCTDLFDLEREMQFAAVTFALPDGSYVLAYRGTDSTLIGWRENFNMSFSCPVPSQTQADLYAHTVAVRTKGKLRLCGHSKGGNLAMYAAACCGDALRERIAEVYLFDAPGLDAATLATDGYRAMQSRVRCYVPQTSIIGRLMGVPENFVVVKSSVSGASQHNTFTWQLNGPALERLPGLDNTSKLIQSTIGDFMQNSTPETRRSLVEVLFGVLNPSSAHTLSDVADRWTDTAGALWNAIMGLDPGVRKAVMSIMSALANNGLDSAKRFLSIEKPEEQAAEK